MLTDEQINESVDAPGSKTSAGLLRREDSL